MWLFQDFCLREMLLEMFCWPIIRSTNSECPIGSARWRVALLWLGIACSYCEMTFGLVEKLFNPCWGRRWLGLSYHCPRACRDYAR